jgi:hypothetical protein
MSDTETKTRTPNPFTAYKKAKAAADRARKAAGRAVELEEKARVAAERAAALTALKDELEEEEGNAYDALQAALADLNTDTDSLDDENDEEL